MILTAILCYDGGCSLSCADAALKQESCKEFGLSLLQVMRYLGATCVLHGLNTDTKACWQRPEAARAATATAAEVILAKGTTLQNTLTTPCWPATPHVLQVQIAAINKERIELHTSCTHSSIALVIITGNSSLACSEPVKVGVQCVQQNRCYWAGVFHGHA